MDKVPDFFSLFSPVQESKQIKVAESWYVQGFADGLSDERCSDLKHETISEFGKN